MKTQILVASILLAFGTANAFAQPVANTVQRDINQAGRLEQEQTRIDRLQAQALKDGKLSPAERVQLTRLQDKSSRNIQAAKSNSIQGNPESKSSERMQAAVQRNVNQEKRIEQGIQSGTLTHREAGKLEHGQAKVVSLESKAARDGHIGRHEQTAIRNQENHQSEKIFGKKHSSVQHNG
jgi:hypothetical protein